MADSVKFTRTQMKRALLHAHYGLFRQLLGDQFKESNFVPGDGDVNAPIVFVGEAPGVEENREKRPFVGKSGKLLDELLHGADMKRGDLFITNFLKYRPPNNRDPKGQEVTTCQYLLRKELQILKPKLVVTLGRFSTGLFFEHPHMGTLAGRMWERRGHIVVPMFHPASALYDTSGDTKKRMIEDMKVIAEVFHGQRAALLPKAQKRRVVLTK